MVATVDHCNPVGVYTPCTMSLLTLANVTIAYGTQIVLDGVTVSVEAGEKVGLIGRNG